GDEHDRGPDPTRLSRRALRAPGFWLVLAQIRNPVSTSPEPASTVTGPRADLSARVASPDDRLLAQRRRAHGEDVGAEQEHGLGLAVPGEVRDLRLGAAARDRTEQLEPARLDPRPDVADARRLLLSLDHEAHRVGAGPRPRVDDPLPGGVDGVAVARAG